VIAAARPAQAEGERALSVGAGFASFSTPGKKTGTMEPPDITPDWGTALSLVYEHTLGTDFSLRGELAGALFEGGNDPKKQSATSYAGIATVGFTYRFDVFTYVPYAFGGVGGVISGGGPIDQHGTGDEFVVELGGGVDWLRSRDRSYGVEVRFASFAGDISITTISLRASTRWGFF
jgi:hypothetical protein